ncbi:sensor histidine kinase [Saccharopolyspora taberi]|uniref:histidine kinase n=1 Tax=Saccharopolyspora taberi TaxID=60895 RepID=A0ABN3VKV7_9PSEU
MRQIRLWIASLPRIAAGLLLGAISAVAELGIALVGGLALRQSAVVTGWARRVTEFERWRLRRFFHATTAEDTARALPYLAVRCWVGFMGGVVLLMLVYGFVASPVVLIELWTAEFTFAGKLIRAVYMVVLGIALLFLGLAGLWGLAAIDRVVGQHFLGSGREEALKRRVAELSFSRAEVITEIDAERRRIERDLHDGVQQRLVALGMLIGRARRADGPRAAELLRQAHEESQQVLHDLREVSWQVYPSALDGDGLHVALENVAERAGIDVRLHYDLDDRPPAAVETAAYFVVSEAVTNAAKHSGARSVNVHLGWKDGCVVVEVDDDGRGGADASGAGLSGLARRVAGLDGSFAVRSPQGGPTTITAELPCE